MVKVLLLSEIVSLCEHCCATGISFLKVATSDFHDVQLKGNKNVFDEAGVVFFLNEANICHFLRFVLHVSACKCASSCSAKQLSQDPYSENNHLDAYLQKNAESKEKSLNSVKPNAGERYAEHVSESRERLAFC